ncbi:hypothetical protein DRN85_02880 [Methanosarcinales archaeon]|nr:MAG: hypothetical protein DRN85_02880 [Methanosarcinales archaeon]RLG27679.1 MAG: hypothetical protein DRN70_01825 [Methanosarcinales archaeon]
MRKRCVICGGEQDTRIYEGYDICTECADLMEDIMGEYFLKVVSQSAKDSKGGYAMHLWDMKIHESDYIRIKQDIERHHRHIRESVMRELAGEDNESRRRYLTRLLADIEWLEENLDFYHHYFENHYLCPTCGGSLFRNYIVEENGDWFLIRCAGCDGIVKKYFLPAIHRFAHVKKRD